MTDAVVLLSGGMDSATLLYHVIADYKRTPLAVSYFYGQRHKTELTYAHKVAEALNVEHVVIDISDVGRLLKGSSLTDISVKVPDGHYAEETMKATVVPNRNAVLLNIAAAIAIGQGAREVFAGMHAGDHPIYPDCRPEFVSALNHALRLGTENAATVETPFILFSKADIVKMGHGLDVRWDITWSCYRGGVKHCGKCGTCTERIEAFRIAEVEDPTPYESLVAYKRLHMQGRVK